MNWETIRNLAELVVCGVVAYVALWVRTQVAESARQTKDEIMALMQANEGKYRQIAHDEVMKELSVFANMMADRFLPSAKSTVTGAEVERRFFEVDRKHMDLSAYAHDKYHELHNQMHIVAAEYSRDVAVLNARVHALEDRD